MPLPLWQQYPDLNFYFHAYAKLKISFLSHPQRNCCAVVNIKSLPCAERHGSRERCDRLSRDIRMNTRLHDQCIYIHPRMGCWHRNQSRAREKIDKNWIALSLIDVILLYGIAFLDSPSYTDMKSLRCDQYTGRHLNMDSSRIRCIQSYINHRKILHTDETEREKR